MRVGVFGGAFNPIHIGHIELGNAFVEKLNLDKLLLVPGNRSPHKSSVQLVSNEHRLKMCQISAQFIENCVVSDLEIKRGGVSYTVDTLSELKEQYENDDFFFICGSDMFFSLLSWKNPDKLFSLCTICAIKRAGDDFEKMDKFKDVLEEKNAKVILLDLEVSPFASSKIREKIKNDESVEGEVLPEVLQYIIENRLYK